MHRRSDLTFNLFAERSIASDGDRQLDVASFAETTHQRRSFLLSRIDQVKNASRSFFTAAIPIVEHLRKPVSDRKPENPYLLLGNAGIAQDIRRIFVGDQEIITDATVPYRVHCKRISDYRDLRKNFGPAVRIDRIDDIVINRIG